MDTPPYAVPGTSHLRLWMPGLLEEFSGCGGTSLTVRCSQKPDKRNYSSMLQSKIRRLMEEDPVETREVFDGGDWLQIRMDCAQSNWSEAVIESDQLMIAMNRIDWSQPGTYIELDEPETIGSFMSEMP